MILINARNKKEIATDAKLANSFLDRLLGLINPQNPRSLIFNTRFGIHTFFMDKNIDILVLDKTNKIVAIKQGLKPYCFFFYNPAYSKIIELPEGSVKSSESKLSDKILFA